MDRLDEDALRKELEGVAVNRSRVRGAGRAARKSSAFRKTGVDECCMALVAQGQVIREEDLQYEVHRRG